MVFAPMKNSIVPLILTSIAHFVNDGFNILLSVLITYYVLIPGLNLSMLGAMAIIFTVISGLLSTPLSIFAQRSGKHVLFLSLGIFLQGLSAFLFVIPFLFHDLDLIFIVLGSILLGVGQSTYHPLGAFIISQSYSGSKSASYMGINGSLGSLGRALFPTVIVLFITLFGYSLGLGYLGILAIVVAILIQFFLRDFNRGPVIKSEKKNKLEKSFLAFVIYLTSLSFLRAVFFNGTMLYIPQYFVEITKSHTLMGIIMTVSLLMAVIGQPLFGHLTSLWGGRVVVAITTIFSILFFAIFLLYSKILLVSVIAFAAYSLFSLTSFPVLMGYVNQKVPKEVSTVSGGIVWGIGVVLGGATGIGLISMLTYFKYSLAESFWITLLFGIISAFMIPWVEKWLKK